MRGVLLFILVLKFKLVSQNFQPYHYVFNTSNGLPTNTVFFIKQSKSGAIYIAHDEGVTRFNGREFTHASSKGKGKALNGVVELNNGGMMACSFYGDLVYLKDSSVILHPYTFNNKTGKPTLKETGNRILIYERANLFEVVSGVLIPYVIPFVKQGVYIQDVIINENGETLLALNYANTITIVTYSKSRKIKSTQSFIVDQSNFVRFVKLKNKLYLYFFNKRNLLEISNEGLKLSNIKFDVDYDQTKWHTLVKQDNLIALLGFDGIVFLNEEGKQINHLLPGVQVSHMMKDVEGNLWVATLNDGVYVFPSLDISVTNLEEILDKNDYVNKVIQLTENNFLLGTFKGKIINFNGVSHSQPQFDCGKNAEVQAFHYDKINEKVYVYCDKLFVLNSKNLGVENTFDVTSTKDVRSVNDKIYCATSAHLIVIGKNERFSRFENTWINSLEFDSLRNCIWLGSNKGILKYDIENDKQSEETLNSLEIKAPLVNKVLRDRSGNIYFSITNYGIVRFNIKNKFETVFKNNKLSNFKINENEFYAITKNEVYIKNLITNDVPIKLDLTKGLEPFVLDFFSAKGSYYAFYGDKIKKIVRVPGINSVQPKLHIHEFTGTYKVQSNNYLISDFSKNNLEFYLEILPNIRSKNTGKIKYKLLDVDDKWIICEPEQSNFRFKYQNLNSGIYNFQAKAINEDGIESELFSLTFEVKPPLWKTWWFIIIEVVLGLCVVLLVYIMRVNAINKRNRLRMEKQINEIKLLSAELTAIRSQMNPHFIFNTLSSIQAKVLSSKSEEAYTQISKFSQLIRSVLDYSSKEYIPLNNELEFIKTYLFLESTRFDGKISYTIHVQDNLDINFIEIPTLITVPFLENAIKHGLLHKSGDKNLDISFTGDNDSLCITITDNGIGRKKSAELNEQIRTNHNSFATEAMQKRIERINQSGKIKVDLSIIDPEEGGVKVIISIKY